MIDPGDLWDHPRPHTLRTQVAAQDIDGLNHTNNAVYVNWCEQVAWSHSVELGLDLERYRTLDRAMAITRAEYDYLHGATLLRGAMRFACIALSSGKPKRLPKEFIEGYGPAVLNETSR